MMQLFIMSREMFMLLSIMTKAVIQISNILDGNWMPDTSFVEQVIDKFGGVF